VHCHGNKHIGEKRAVATHIINKKRDSQWQSSVAFYSDEKKKFADMDRSGGEIEAKKRRIYK
jgi:hypothetical protein